LKQFIFKKDLSRVPLSGNLILLYRGIPNDQVEVFVIALENDTYSKEEYSFAFKLAISNKSKNVLDAFRVSDRIEEVVRNQVVFDFLFDSQEAFKNLIDAGVRLSFFKPEFLIFCLQSAAIFGFGALTEAILDNCFLFDYLNRDGCEKPWELAQQLGHTFIVEIFKRHGYAIYTLSDALDVHDFEKAAEMIKVKEIDDSQLRDEAFDCLDRKNVFGMAFLLQNYVPVTSLKSGISVLSRAMLNNDFEAVSLLISSFNSPLQVLPLPISPEMLNYVKGIVFESHLSLEERK
jgi:hypothetical protein